MARPSLNNAGYFYHSANFRNDRRVKAIRARFGMAGYGLLLMLMEALTDADNTELATDDMELELLAGDFGVSVTEIDSLLQICEKIGLFCRNEAGNLTSIELKESLRSVFEKRNRSREAFEKRKQAVSVTETTISVTETARIEENRIEEKEKKRKSAVRAPVDFVFPASWSKTMIDAYQNEWLEFRQKKREKLLPESIQKQIDKLADSTEKQLIDCLNNSICNGYSGLFPEKFTPVKPIQQSRPVAKHNVVPD